MSFSLFFRFRSTFRTFTSSRSLTFHADTNLCLFLRSCFASTNIFFFSFLHPLYFPPLHQSSLTDRFDRLLSSSYIIRLAVLLVACNSGPYEYVLVSHVNCIDVRNLSDSFCHVLVECLFRCAKFSQTRIQVIA